MMWPESRLVKLLRETAAFERAGFEARLREKDDLIRYLKGEIATLKMQANLRSEPKKASEIAKPLPSPVPEFEPQPQDYQSELADLEGYYRTKSRETNIAIQAQNEIHKFEANHG